MSVAEGSVLTPSLAHREDSEPPLACAAYDAPTQDGAIDRRDAFEGITEAHRPRRLRLSPAAKRFGAASQGETALVRSLYSS